MAESISANLKTIEEESRKLNAAADSLTKAIRALNEHLAAMNVGITTYYTDAFFETPSDSVTGDLQLCRYYIGYDRDQEGTWGISIMCRAQNPYVDRKPKERSETASDTTQTNGEVRWIRGFDKCPRNVRLALCGYVPKVIEGLATAVRNVSGSLDRSLKEIEGIQSLSGATKK